MDYHRGDVLLRDIRSRRLVVQQSWFTIGDEAPILHRACWEIGHGHHIHLGKLIILLETVGEILETLYADRQSVFGLIDGVWPGPNIEIFKPLHFHGLEFRDHEGYQISRHRDAFLEFVPIILLSADAIWQKLKINLSIFICVLILVWISFMISN